MKAIFFNAKGVLYDRPDPTYYLRAFLEANGLEAAPSDVLKKTLPNLKDQIMRGRLVPEVYSDALLKACGVTNPALFPEGEKVIERDHANIVLIPGVISTLGTLKERGFKLGVITDSSTARQEKTLWMRACGLQVEWDAYANSKELQALKPDLTMYQSAMRQAGVSAEESAFVGHDQIELTGARRLGMTALALFCGPEIEADFHLDKFEELLSLPILQSVS